MNWCGLIFILSKFKASLIFFSTVCTDIFIFFAISKLVKCSRQLRINISWIPGGNFLISRKIPGLNSWYTICLSVCERWGMFSRISRCPASNIKSRMWLLFCILLLAVYSLLNFQWLLFWISPRDWWKFTQQYLHKWFLLYRF